MDGLSLSEIELRRRLVKVPTGMFLLACVGATAHEQSKRRAMLAREFNDGNLFENEVRNIARELWLDAKYHGAQIYQNRERDGIFETEDTIHCLECTISKEEKKTRGDLDKLNQIVEDLRRKYPKKAVKGWFVTLHEPTAEQAWHIIGRRRPINHETLIVP